MHNSSVRPRFELNVNLPIKEVKLLFDSALKTDVGVSGLLMNNHIILKIPHDKRHYWSPQLDINIESNEEGTNVRGLIGPRPNVWTLFLFIYGILAILGLIGSIVAMSHWSLGKESNWSWLMIISILGCIVLYFVSQAGKKLGSHEMKHLYQFATHILKDNISTKTAIEEL